MVMFGKEPILGRRHINGLLRKAGFRVELSSRYLLVQLFVKVRYCYLNNRSEGVILW